MVWESVPPASQLCLTHQCIEDLNTSLPPFTQIQFFFFFYHLSSRSCYHIHYHCMGITSSAYARGMTTTPSGGTQTTMPPLPLFPTCQFLNPPPLYHPSPLKPCKSRCHHCLIHRHISKICFFSSFFVSFLTSVTETSFPHITGSQTPTSPPYLTPQALQVPLPPLPHLQACK